MKRSKLAVLKGMAQLLVVWGLLILSEKPIQAQMGVSYSKSARPRVLDLAGITPSGVFSNARYQTGGVALRNHRLGTISVSGVPLGSTVRKAYLYWMWASLATPVPGIHDQVSFQRLTPDPPTPEVLRVGTLVGSGADPCWLGDSNFVYRADVTGLVSRGGVYKVTLRPGSAGRFDRTDPFGFPGEVAPLAEGASLVIVYSNAVEPMGTVRIYDVGLAGTMFNDALTYNLADLPAGGTLSLWDTIGGDGQSGIGRSASDFGAETTTIDGIPVAGPGSAYNDSDWNGSDGRPLPQLWDTHGHQVDLPIGASGSVTVSYTSQGDCLVPVANITLTFP